MGALQISRFKTPTKLHFCHQFVIGVKSPYVAVNQRSLARADGILNCFSYTIAVFTQEAYGAGGFLKVRCTLLHNQHTAWRLFVKVPHTQNTGAEFRSHIQRSKVYGTKRISVEPTFR